MTVYESRAAVLAGVLAVGCATTGGTLVPAGAPPQTTLEARAAAASMNAWRAAGLPVTPSAKGMAELRIELPESQAAYEARCPPGLLGESQACLRWLGWDVPVAVVSPGVARAAVARAAVHEWMHAAGYRFGLWPDYDAAHTDVRVWEPSGAEAAAKAAVSGD